MKKQNCLSSIYAFIFSTNLHSIQLFTSAFNSRAPLRHTRQQIRHNISRTPSTIYNRNTRIEMGGASSDPASEMASTNSNENSNPVEKLGLPTPLILGSGSFTRKLILKEMGIDYQLMVRPIDEQSFGDRDGNPSELVLTLAKAKAAHLIDGILQNDVTDLELPPREEGWIVLTCDQVVTHNNLVLEKPQDIEQAKQFANGYATNSPRTVGSCVLTHIPSMIQVSGVDTATIHFKATVAECQLIERLVEDDAPVLSCAGGLMVEHPFVKEHIKGIDGTEDSVMGLSKQLVEDLLKELKNKLDDCNEKRN